MPLLVMTWLDGVLTKVFGPKNSQLNPSFNLAKAMATTVEIKNRETIVKEGKLGWKDIGASALTSTLVKVDKTGEVIAEAPGKVLRGLKLALMIFAGLLTIWLVMEGQKMVLGQGFWTQRRVLLERRDSSCNCNCKLVSIRESAIEAEARQSLESPRPSS